MTTRQVVAVGIVFVLSTAGLAYVFGAIFGDFVMGIGPAMAVSAGIAGATYVLTRPKPDRS